MSEIKVGIIGATGYTGVELLRLLVAHPNVRVVAVCSRQNQGTAVADMFPTLRGKLALEFVAPSLDVLQECDVVFSAAPNGVAMNYARDLNRLGIKLIDLSADFRIKDVAVWQQWYNQTHSAPELIPQAVYGLPELYRQQIQKANLIACPGCYPTATTLAFLPLLANNLVDSADLIADAKSGTSGAGRSASIGSLFAEVAEDFKAYAVAGHRHLPEISQTLKNIAADAGANSAQLNLTFVPHLLPMVRGIEVSCYSTLNAQGQGYSQAQLVEMYQDFYQDEGFVDVLAEGVTATTASVRASNMCRISVFRPQGGNKVVVLAVIDNLTKGAAGQAVQNMNLICQLPEHTGLLGAPVYP